MKEKELKNGLSFTIQKDKASCDKDYNLALNFCVKNIDKLHFVLELIMKKVRCC